MRRSRSGPLALEAVDFRPLPRIGSSETPLKPSKRPNYEWVVEADIEAGFVRIDHVRLPRAGAEDRACAARLGEVRRRIETSASFIGATYAGSGGRALLPANLRLTMRG